MQTELSEIPYVDWYNLIAEQRGFPKGWRWYEVRVIGDPTSRTILATGGVPKIVTRGPRKGGPSWRGVEKSEMLVTVDQIDEFKATWEKSTGKCSACYGVGQQVHGVNADGARTMKDCKKCSATGKVPA